MKKKVAIRVDVSPKIGTGHAMRCLALAQGLKGAGFDVCFLMSEAGNLFNERLAREGISFKSVSASSGSISNLAETRKIISEMDCEVVVLDGYQFDAEYQRGLKEISKKLLCIDDYGHAGSYCADFVLNQNLSADAALYSNRSSETKFLLGPRYALLRREFLTRRPLNACVRERVQKILVTMGGADSANVTLKVVKALAELDVQTGVEALIVVGAENPHYASLEAAMNKAMASGHGINMRLLRGVDDMAALMAEADIAISAAGSTCWELAYMGVPSLLLVLAENQEQIAEGLDKYGAALNLGRHHDVSQTAIVQALMQLIDTPSSRSSMTVTGQKLVDGGGVFEVAMCLEGARFGLRRAKPEDCKVVWRLANDPTAREVSFSTDPIPWKTHVQWFSAKLSDDRCFFLIATDENQRAFGYARIDREAEYSTISVAVEQSFRKQGYGAEIIRYASQRALDISYTRKICALIKEGNASSLRAFRKAGFEYSGVASMQGQQVAWMRLGRKEGI